VPEIDAAAVRWSAPDDERSGRPLMVLLHGVGSHEGDLIGLAPRLSPEYVYASLRAPLTYGDGWSWYPLTTPGAPDFGAVDDAAASVLAWLDRLGDAHPSVSLLGFSQGGSLSLQLLRARPTGFDSVVVLAGFIVPGAPDAVDAAVAAARPPVFYGRGDIDQVIPGAAVARTEAWLEAHAAAEIAVYPGLAHGVSQEELDDVNAFLGRVRSS
jgi:phospholipase/carboxylesterase